MKFLKKVIYSETKYDWQDKIQPLMQNEKNQFEYGLITIMTRTGTGKSFIAPKGIINDSKKYNKTFVYVPNNQKNLIIEHENSLETFCKNECIEYTKNKKDKSTEYDIKLKNKNYKYEILSFVHNGSSIKKIMEHENHVLYFDEEDSYQTQFGLVHAGNKYQHSQTRMELLYNSFKKEKDDGNNFFSNIISLSNKNKLFFISATLDDNFINDLFPYTLKMNILNIVIKHKRENFSEIPIHYFSKKEDILQKVIDTYISNEKSYIFVSNSEKLKSVFQYLTETTNSVDEKDIYFWHSKMSGKCKFSSEKAKNTKICIFVNKGTTGINDLELKNIFIIRNLNAKSTSSRDMENKCISNICLQIMGRIRSNGNVYWYGENIESKKNSNWFDLTETFYSHALSEKIAKRHRFGLEIIKKKYDCDFQNYFIRPFIFAYICQKHWNVKTKTDENSILFAMNKFRGECETMYNKMNNCIGVDERDSNNNRNFKFINKDSGLQFHFTEEYFQLEEKIMESYKEVICKYSPNYSIFFT